MAIKRTISVHESSGSTSKRLKRSGSFSKPSTPMRRKKTRTYGQVGPEIKFLDVETLNEAASATPVVISCNTLAQGLTNITRIGNKIQIKSLALHMQGQPTTGAIDTTAPNTMKWSLVLDKEPEAAAIASYNQIYDGNNIHSMRNINESDRFVVLATGIQNWDGCGQITAAGAFNQAAGSTFFVEKFVNCDIASKYTLTTATQTAFGTNQLLLAICWKNTDANHLLDMKTRIRFTDE